MKNIFVRPSNPSKPWFKINGEEQDEYVLRCSETCHIQPYDSWTVNTNICIDAKNVLMTNQQHKTIDRNVVLNSIVLNGSGEYECRPVLFNISDKPIEIKKGDIISSISFHTMEVIHIVYPETVYMKRIKVIRANDHYRTTFLKGKKTYRCDGCHEVKTREEIEMCPEKRCFRTVCKDCGTKCSKHQ